MKAPSGVTGDSSVASRAEAALFKPEKAKNARTPKRILHMIRFAFFEIGFAGRIIGVRVASDLDVSLDGGVSGQQ